MINIALVLDEYLCYSSSLWEKDIFFDLDFSINNNKMTSSDIINGDLRASSARQNRNKLYHQGFNEI